MLRRLLVAAVAALALATSCSATETDTPSPATATPQLPPAHAGFDYQLGGDSPLPDGVSVVVRQWHDGEAAPGAYSICYVNAFQTEAEPDSPDHASKWPQGVVWAEGEDPQWPGEQPIDLSTAQNRARAADFVTERFRTCTEKGFAAVELDNLDTFTRYDDAPFDRDDTIAYARLLVERATSLGLAVGQKNTTELLDVGRTTIGFSFAVVEQCGESSGECTQFTHTYGDHVYAVEYSPDGFGAACREIGTQASVVRRDLHLVAQGEIGYLYSTC